MSTGDRDYLAIDRRMRLKTAMRAAGGPGSRSRRVAGFSGSHATSVFLRTALSRLGATSGALLEHGGGAASGDQSLRLRGLLTPDPAGRAKVTTWEAGEALALTCTARSMLGHALVADDAISGLAHGLCTERPGERAAYAVAAPVRAECEPIGVFYAALDEEPARPDELRRLATGYGAVASLCLLANETGAPRAQAELALRARREARCFAGSGALSGAHGDPFTELIREMGDAPVAL